MWDLSSIARLESPAVTEWSSFFWDGPGVLIDWALIPSPSLQYNAFVSHHAFTGLQLTLFRAL